jgi:hypothetical protein
MKKHKTYYHTSGHRYKVGDVIGGPGKVVCLHTSPIPHGTIDSIVDSGHRSWTEYSEQHSKDVESYWEKREEWNRMREETRPVYKSGEMSVEEYREAIKKWNEDGELGIGKPEWPTTRSPKPARLFVYKMKPYNPESPRFNGMNDEFRVYDDFVEVIGIEGNAKGILHNHRKKFGKTARAWHFGGKSLRHPKSQD